MLKGKMIIEMTDVNTGEKETVLEENMVTDALAEIFKPLGLAKSAGKLMNSFAPYYQNLLGGLLLFDTPIEENARNMYAPSTANLIGCASYGVQNNTTGTLRGGFNQTESELNMTDHYMKYVYDFATSQANGTISCVCLTHKNAGFTSYGGKDAPRTDTMLGIQIDDATLQYSYPNYTGGNTGDKYTGYTIGTTELLFLVDEENDLVYYFRIDNTNKITIISRRAYLKSVSVIENPYNRKYFVDSVEIELSKPLLNNANYCSYNYDDGFLYIVSPPSYQVTPNAVFLITKINVKNWSVTQYEMTNTTNENLSMNGMRSTFVHRGFILVRGYNSPYSLYKMEIGNAANVTKFKLTGMSSVNGTPELAINGRVYFDYYTGGAYYLYVANLDTNEVLMSEASRLAGSNNLPCCTPVLGRPLLFYASYGTWSTYGFVMMANYLATINNLSEAVTKTADKTMKVTYIIQEQ